MFYLYGIIFIIIGFRSFFFYPSIIDKLAKKKNKRCVKASWINVRYKSRWEKTKETYEYISSYKKKNGISENKTSITVFIKLFFYKIKKYFVDKSQKVSVIAIVFQYLILIMWVIYVCCFELCRYIIISSLAFSYISIGYGCLNIITLIILAVLYIRIIDYEDRERKYDPYNDGFK